MTAKSILNDTLKILGYTDSDGNPELTQRLYNHAVVTFNLVYEDLWRICNKGDFVPIKSLAEEVRLPQKVMGDTIIYGLAMHIARNENDGDQQQYYAYLYNSRRAGLTEYKRVNNVIPRGGDI